MWHRNDPFTPNLKNYVQYYSIFLIMFNNAIYKNNSVNENVVQNNALPFNKSSSLPNVDVTMKKSRENNIKQMAQPKEMPQPHSQPNRYIVILLHRYKSKSLSHVHQ